MPKQHNSTITITPQPAETEKIQQLEKILHSGNTQPRLVGSNGETVILPDSVYDALCQVIRAMVEGKEISLVPSNRELTTQEAADILNVSRPYLTDKLLKPGIIPHTMVGNRHRIRFHDVMTYKQQRDQDRRQSLNDFTEFLQDEGFYDE